MVQVAIGGIAELERAEANVVKGLIVNAKSAVRVLYQLMHRQRGIVGFDDCIRDFWRRHHRKGTHHTIWEFFANFGDEQRAHTGTRTTTKRMSYLETLKTHAVFGLFTDYVENLIDELGTLGIVPLGPIIASTRLTKDKVVRSEEGTI